MLIINCDLFANQIEECGVAHYALWEKKTALSLRIGKFFRKIGLYKYGNINPKLNNLDSDSIVVFDNGIYENSVLKWLSNRYKNRRLIFYYWNPVFKSIAPTKIPKQFELWSYSPEDCRKYNMKYNSTFFFESFYKPPVQIRRDVFFVGKEKGRLKELMKIKEKITNQGLSSLFYITANHPRLKQKKYMNAIPYNKVLDYVNESRIVLDYYVDPNAGLSLRALESLFFEKKIITNNLTYPSYDFYKKENVFILGKEPERNIIDFLSSPFVQLPSYIKEQYLFSNWVKRMSK